MRTLMLAITAGAAFALASTTAVASVTPSTTSITHEVPRTAQEKRAIVQWFVDSTTACVARIVRKHPHFLALNITELIVQAFNPCAEPASAMVHQHDVLYGEGSGHKFLMGPYLDYLPSQVQQFEDK